MELVPRKTALEVGLKHYYTGKACSRGHYSTRFTGCRSCVECKSIHRKLYLQANPDKRLQYENNYFDKNPGSRQEKDAKRYTKNKGKINAYNATRRALRILRIPKWLTPNQLLEIEAFYKRAQQHNPPLEVDHIVPLLGGISKWVARSLEFTITYGRRKR